MYTPPASSAAVLPPEFDAPLVFAALPPPVLPTLTLPALNLQASPAAISRPSASRPGWSFISSVLLSVSGSLRRGFGFDERAEHGEVARVVAEFVLRSLQQERGVGEARGAGDAPERVRADVAEAEMPVAVNARVVFGLRVVEVDGAHVAESDVRVERVERGTQSVVGAQGAAGCEGVRRVEADAQG